MLPPRCSSHVTVGVASPTVRRPVSRHFLSGFASFLSLGIFGIVVSDMLLVKAPPGC